MRATADRPQDAPQDDEVEAEQEHRPHEAALLAEHGEHEVRPPLGQEVVERLRGP